MDAHSEFLDAADDWAGLEDAAERRRRQNRVHQRAWRRRKVLQTSQAALAASSQGTLSSGFWALKPIAIPQRQSSTPAAVAAKRLIQPLLQYHDGSLAADGSCIPSLDQFPLSLDHRLITLIQFNVLRAAITNMTILSILHMAPSECGFQQMLAQMWPPPSPGVDIPPSLRPTALQRTTPHEWWINSVPAAGMRDALIRHRGAYDEDDLCCDMMGGLYEGFDDVERRGIIVWSDPWSVDGWEVTEGFARKWTFLLEGCGDLLAATNRYRAQRGEDPLVVEAR